MPSITLAEFADRLNETMPILLKEFLRRQSAEIYGGKITLPQFLVMDFIVKNKDVKMKDLAGFMKVAMATMTGIVERLVRQRYVERAADANDRRIIKVKLTKAGAAFMNRVYKRRRQVLINIFSQIPAADRDEYLRILNRIKEVLIEQPEDVREGEGKKC